MICILFPENKADISYFGTEYEDFPLPRLVFGFHITKEGRVGSCRLGVIDNDDICAIDNVNLTGQVIYSRVVEGAELTVTHQNNQ
jgi:hypothetical protein